MSHPGNRRMRPSLPETAVPVFAGALALLLVGTWLVYAPGLSGAFLLDDMSNLDALGRMGGVDSWATAVEYLLGSHTSTGGRPVALASFLLDDVAWPSNPAPFKYTNVLFHLLAMTGVIWLALQLARALGLGERRQYALALLAGAVWGLHPFLVSTVLYVVQRMAVLAALFVVFGLGCYVRGRHLLADGQARAGYAWMTAGIAVFTPLAFLSKPNGGLLPVLAFVLDVTLLRHLGAPATEGRRYRAWRHVFIHLPLALIVAYFALFWDKRVLEGYAWRPFSLGERLLTEARILLDYVGQLVVPRIQTAGLYHDNYPVSTGLLAPPATLVAVLAVAGALTAAIALRRRLPLVSAAVLFFLAAHVLESSFVPLELYYEHRNYLPAVLPAIALAFGLVRLFERQRLAAGLAGVALVAVLASLTLGRAALWGDPRQLALTWAEENPGSPRAQQHAAIVYLEAGIPELASAALAEGIEHNPDSSMLRVQHLVTTCMHNGLREHRLEQAIQSIDRSHFQSYTVRHLEVLGDFARTGRCGELQIGDVLRLVEAGLAHPGIAYRASIMEELLYLKGNLLLADGRPDMAQEAFLAAAAATRNVEGAIQMAAVMATAGHYRHALTLLDHAERDLERSRDAALSGIRRSLRYAALDYASEIARLRARIRERAGKPGDADG